MEAVMKASLPLSSPSCNTNYEATKKLRSLGWCRIVSQTRRKIPACHAKTVGAETFPASENRFPRHIHRETVCTKARKPRRSFPESGTISESADTITESSDASDGPLLSATEIEIVSANADDKQSVVGEISERRSPLPGVTMELPTFEDVCTAAYRIRDGIVRTECKLSEALSEHTGCQLYLKHEYKQRTGSFKERGARNALMLLSEEQKKIGVVAASAGNHALGLAYHGRDLNVPVTVVMPTNAPLVKVQKCRELGARVVQHGIDLAEAVAHAHGFVESEGRVYINGFDHPHILAGQGTIGLEILEQVPDVDAVVVPVGGAGLIAGIALAVKKLRPWVQVIGVEPTRAASFTAAMEAGQPVQIELQGPSLADGLAVACVGPHAFAVAQTRVDRVVRVSEKDIGLSMLRLVELEKLVQEGAGAGGLAAVLAGHLPDLRGKKVVVPLCGGNIDTTVLGRVIERGLAADSRLMRFSVNVRDAPGSLAVLTSVVADEGASIKDILHERAWLVDDVAHVQVFVVVETTGRDHVKRLQARLDKEILGKGPIQSWGQYRLVPDIYATSGII